MMHIIIVWHLRVKTQHEHIIYKRRLPSGPVISAVSLSLWPSAAAAADRRSVREFESVALRTAAVTSHAIPAEACLMNINDAATRAASGRSPIGYEAGVSLSGCNEY